MQRWDSWVRSSYSTTAGECVEVLREGSSVLVRDSAISTHLAFRVSFEAWVDFVSGRLAATQERPGRWWWSAR
ncbi:DUF397 domain-containing protein [Streptomyces sp. NPDC127108]|uniref:DUF397 domain-containing protein n=1 Tax=Streptomyces sp. NPDC127108 TaxID=3345361 RepID=UPI0036270C9B